jgi:hypothetical protein
MQLVAAPIGVVKSVTVAACGGGLTELHLCLSHPELAPLHVALEGCPPLALSQHSAVTDVDADQVFFGLNICVCVVACARVCVCVCCLQHKVTLDPSSRELAGIPDNATTFAWCYPAALDWSALEKGRDYTSSACLLALAGGWGGVFFFCLVEFFCPTSSLFLVLTRRIYLF